MITEVSSKGIETRNADKSECRVTIDMFVKGINVAETLEKSACLAEAVQSLVTHVDSLVEKVRDLEAQVAALKEDHAKDDKEVEELSKKLETVAKARAPVTKKQQSAE